MNHYLNALTRISVNAVRLVAGLQAARASVARPSARPKHRSSLHAERIAPGKGHKNPAFQPPHGHQFIVRVSPKQATRAMRRNLAAVARFVVRATKALGPRLRFEQPRRTYCYQIGWRGGHVSAPTKSEARAEIKRNYGWRTTRRPLSSDCGVLVAVA